MSRPLLEIENVSKTFGGLKAVSSVSLSVEAGSLCALIGPNGAGKTTLFALMTGFIKPDQGSVRFDGTDITGQAPHLNAVWVWRARFRLSNPLPHKPFEKISQSACTCTSVIVESRLKKRGRSRSRSGLQISSKSLHPS